MALDFASDTVKINSVSKELKNIAAEIRIKTNDIYNLIENDLSNYWKSSTYQDFVNGCNNYKVPLEDLAKVLESFGEKLDKVSNNTDDLIMNINSKLK